MSDAVSLGNDIDLPAHAATIETIFAYLRQHVPNHPEFQTLVAREREFDYMGGWFFDNLSPDAFRLLKVLMGQMAQDLPAAAILGHWNEAWKPAFYADVERFRAKLAERIAQLDHSTP